MIRRFMANLRQRIFHSCSKSGFRIQKEYRICVQTATTGDNPITIDIGNIGHICAKIKSSEIMSHFELKSGTTPTLTSRNGPRRGQGPRDAAPGLLRCARNDGLEVGSQSRAGRAIWLWHCQKLANGQ